MIMCQMTSKMYIFRKKVSSRKNSLHPLYYEMNSTKWWSYCTKGICMQNGWMMKPALFIIINNNLNSHALERIWQSSVCNLVSKNGFKFMSSWTDFGIQSRHISHNCLITCPVTMCVSVNRSCGSLCFTQDVHLKVCWISLVIEKAAHVQQLSLWISAWIVSILFCGRKMYIYNESNFMIMYSHKGYVCVCTCCCIL